MNVSARQFAQSGFVAQIREVLSETHVPPGALTIEITESVAMGEVDRTIGVLSQLGALGVRLSIDDFGTGYSSLSYLHRLPLDVLKIDRSFIARMADGGDGYRIVQTIMALARTLRMDVVAEGAETAAQIAQLQALGCDYAQGYYLSRPVDAEAAAAMLFAPPFSLPQPQALTSAPS